MERVCPQEDVTKSTVFFCFQNWHVKLSVVRVVFTVKPVVKLKSGGVHRRREIHAASG